MLGEATQAGIAFNGIEPEELGFHPEITVDPHTGSAAIKIPLALSRGRHGFGPEFALHFDSSAINSPFGTGWSLAGSPYVGINLRKGLPRYSGSDVYTFTAGGELRPDESAGLDQGAYRVRYYVPRVELGFVRVEQWTEKATGRVHWRTRDTRNTVVIYGFDAGGLGRIADPHDPFRTFTWLPELAIDSVGNAIRYTYAAEDSAGVDFSQASERHRGESAQRYLKRVLYGNTRPMVVDAPEPAGNQWCFSVVIDYGDHDPAAPAFQPDRSWPVRLDPFSTYRPGFEVRTHRLCRRILLFHNFNALGPQPVLIGSYQLGYNEDAAGTTLTSIGYTGYTETTEASLPPLLFSYSAPSVARSFSSPPLQSTENVPAGLSGSVYRLVDLHGEGLAGILAETGDAWFYKPNLGNGNFGPQSAVAERPSWRLSECVINDFDGDGNINVAVLHGREGGYYEYDRDAQRWTSYRSLPSMPHIEAARSKAQWLDLNGDGRADLLLADPEKFTWYPSEGKDGFSEPVELQRPAASPVAPQADEPSIDFRFADMNGDGLADQVLIRNGRVEYWPHLGNGAFGDPVLMEDSPVFAPEGQFDLARAVLADLDGNGAADLIYLGNGELRYWINCCGNRWIEGGRIGSLPYIDRFSNVQVLDFLGDGTPCLVWSSPLAGNSAPLQYLPLTSGLHPHLLESVDNSMGRQVRLQWASSTTHYLRDLNVGRPWSTRLPMHPMVVNRMDTVDAIGGARAVRRFEYHDGYYDSGELEFRGFSQVDQYDSDSDNGATTPTCLRTWYHPGAAVRASFSDLWHGDALAVELPPHSFEDLTSLEPREYEDGLRAISGCVLRQESYRVLPSGARAANPIQTIQTSYRLRRMARALADLHASFYWYAAESLTCHYEEQPDDPRVTHELTLAVDQFGNVLQEGRAAYARRAGKPVESTQQSSAIVVATRHSWLNFDAPDRRECGIVTEALEFEISGIGPNLQGWATLQRVIGNAVAAPIEFDQNFAAGVQARRIGWARSFYTEPGAGAELPFGAAGSPVLIHHTETACLTPGNIANLFAARVDNNLLQNDCGYSLHDGYWWRSSASQEYAPAAAFRVSMATVRPDGGRTVFGYDPPNLARVSVSDPLNNTATAEVDYRRMGAWRITDINQNIAEVQYDGLGVIVVGTSYGQILDSAGVVQDYGQQPLAKFVAPAAPTFSSLLNDPGAAVQNAATYTWYDLNRWRNSAQPTCAIRLLRENYAHDGTAAAPAQSKVQVRVFHIDGFGRRLQSKLLSEGGQAIERDGAGNLVMNGEQPAQAAAAKRWLVSGHTVFNGKQQPVREYEPFFSPVAAFEPEAVLAQYGVSRLIQYDCVGRKTREDFPNGSYCTIEFTPWQITRNDANDTVLSSDYRTQRNDLPNGDPEKQALIQSEAHAGTPNISQLNPRGLSVKEVAVAAPGGANLVTLIEIDVRDQVTTITDPRGLRAFTHTRDMLGRELLIQSMDAGELRVLPDIYGRIAHTWDARGIHQHRTFDRLDRPLTLKIDGGLGLNNLVDHRVYGEDASVNQAQQRNLRGRLAVHRDSAGIAIYDQYNLKGELLRSSRQFRKDYKQEAEWTNPGAVAMEGTIYAATSEMDALGRPVRQALPDGTRRDYTYLQGGGSGQCLISTPDGALNGFVVIGSSQFNARGQRESALLGNGVTVTHRYDPATFRTTRITVAGESTLMDLQYVYDAVGNIVWSTDLEQAPAAPGPFLQGLNVSPDQTFVYDEFYRLAQATGRVHQALLQYDFAPGNTTAGWVKGTRHLSLNNGAAVERYTRQYTYDLAGNLKKIHHQGISHAWNTDVWIAPDSNRGLLATDLNGNPIANPAAQFDSAGNCASVPNLKRLEWNYRGSIAKAVIIDRSGSGSPDDAEYYVYDSRGIRMRKITEKLNGGQLEVADKRYLDGCDIVRRTLGGALQLERLTSHVLDGKQRVAMVHRWTADTQKRETDDITKVRVRYQLTNHLGSSLLELDELGAVINYEEYFPFGGTSFLAGDRDREVAIRDYRFCGKEADDVTGLYYCANRYYAPWIGRWISPDPAGPEDTSNLFEYCRNNPVSYSDPSGLQSTATDTGVRYNSVSSIPPEIRRLLTPSQIKQVEAGTHGVWKEGGRYIFLPRDKFEERVRQAALKERVNVNIVDSGSGAADGTPGTGGQNSTNAGTAGNANANNPAPPTNNGQNQGQGAAQGGQKSTQSGADLPNTSPPPNPSLPSGTGNSPAATGQPDAKGPVCSEQCGDGDGTGDGQSGGSVQGTPGGDPNGAPGNDPNGVPASMPDDYFPNGVPGNENVQGRSDGDPSGNDPNGSATGSPSGTASANQTGNGEQEGTDISWGRVAWSAAKTIAIGAAAIVVGAALVAAGIISAPFLIAIGVLTLIGVGLMSFFKRAEEALDEGKTDRTGQAALAAMGDTVGITGIYEGATGKDAVTDRTLRTTERSDRLGTGIGSVTTILAGPKLARLGNLAGTSALARSGYTLYDVPSISRPSYNNPLVTGTYTSPQGVVWRANAWTGIRAGWETWRAGTGFWTGFEGRGGAVVPPEIRAGAGNFWHIRSHFADMPARPGPHSFFVPELQPHIILMGDAPYITTATGGPVRIGPLDVQPGNVLDLNLLYPQGPNRGGAFVGNVYPNPSQIGTMGGTPPAAAPPAGTPLYFGYRFVVQPLGTGQVTPVTMYPE